MGNWFDSETDDVYFVQTSMKEFPGYGMNVRVSVRSKGWVCGSLWMTVEQFVKLRQVVEAGGLKVGTTKRFDEYLKGVK